MGYAPPYFFSSFVNNKGIIQYIFLISWFSIPSGFSAEFDCVQFAAGWEDII